MAQDNRLGEFLQSRRSRINPGEVGISDGVSRRGRRRVAGLRREELAGLAGVSVDYYQRLEQGRALHPSDEVLGAIADALCLDNTERRHLRALAAPRRDVPAPPRLRAELCRMLTFIDKMPALVITDRFDVLSANALAVRMFAATPDALCTNGNLARSLFLEPAAREFYVEWTEVAAATVAQLRFVAGRYPADANLVALIEELSTKSADFASLWSVGDVEIRAHGTKHLRHPAIGALTLHYENFNLPSDSRQRLVTFSPPATASETALGLLAAGTTSTDIATFT